MKRKITEGVCIGRGEIVESRGDAIHRVSIGTSRSNDLEIINSYVIQ